MKASIAITIVVALSWAARPVPAAADTGCCGATCYITNSGTCNPNGILPTAAKCDWNCTNTGQCPHFTVDCPTLNCDIDGDGKCTVCGTASTTYPDTIYGSPGDDIICAKAGNDTVIADQGGNDIIDGSSGNDVIQAGPGNDYLYGSSGDDCIGGGGGSDMIDGAGGNDGLFGQCLPAFPSCNVGDSPLLGSRMCGADGNDLLVAYSGNNGHHCLDGGKNQASIEPSRCGFGASGPDCWYVGDAFGSNEHDTVTFRLCNSTILFGASEDQRLDISTCGCFPP